jgi:transcriptional regulator with XRE-family HTH domain
MAGLTQAQAAQLMHLHRPTVSEIEAARRKVLAEELERFANIYSVSVTWLASGEGEGDSETDDRVRLAARQLSNLSDKDLDRVLNLLKALRKKGGKS